MRVLFLTLALVPACIFAQGEPGFRKSSLGFAAELDVPVGDFSSLAGPGYGGIARFQYGTNFRAAATVSLGYLVWSKKDFVGGSIQAQAFEAMAGAKAYFTPGFFGSIEAGLYFFSFTRTGNVIGAEGSATRFMMPVGIGYQKSGFEIGARYYIFNANANSFSFTLGYNWML